MIVATAGHVDHGKTTLVRALTGVDTEGGGRLDLDHVEARGVEACERVGDGLEADGEVAQVEADADAVAVDGVESFHGLGDRLVRVGVHEVRQVARLLAQHVADHPHRLLRTGGEAVAGEPGVAEDLAEVTARFDPRPRRAPSQPIKLEVTPFDQLLHGTDESSTAATARTSVPDVF